LPANSQEDIYEAKVLECMLDEKSKKPQYLIHYKGWNKRWDEWVDCDRLLQINASKELSVDSKSSKETKIMKQSQSAPILKSESKPPSTKSQAIQNPQILAPQKAPESVGKKRKSRADDGGTSKRRRLNDDGKRKGDGIPLDIKLSTALKRKLIGDWESITKKQLVVDLPRSAGSRVCDILRDFERCAVRGGQDKKIVAEIGRGIKDYFNQALRVTLLYKAERGQLEALCKAHGDLTMDQIYGVEHLCRLFVKLPKLLSPDELDHATRRILKMQIEFMLKFVVQKQEYWESTHYVPAAR